jgi:hypothetical protein
MRFGQVVEDGMDLRHYEMLVRSGHVIDESGAIRLSDDGICVADEIIRRLVK